MFETGISGNTQTAPPLGRLETYTKKIDQMARFYSSHFGFSIVRLENDRTLEIRACF
jgi:predicted enzyme related to lactoylglutathione lyase